MSDKHETDYERRDVDGASIVKAGVIVGVVSVLAAVAALGLFNFLASRARSADPPNPPLARHEQGRQPPEPRLQEMPFKDAGELQAAEHEILTSSAWIDQRAGLARIPLEDALVLVAGSGRLPNWAPAPAASPSPASMPGASPATGGGKR